MAKEKDRFDEPIWRLEVAYEALLRGAAAHSTYLRASEVLYDLLSAYPKKLMPADFTPEVLEEWAQARRDVGYSRTMVFRDMEHVTAFFRWIKLRASG